MILEVDDVVLGLDLIVVVIFIVLKDDVFLLIDLFVGNCREEVRGWVENVKGIVNFRVVVVVIFLKILYFMWFICILIWLIK